MLNQAVILVGGFDAWLAPVAETHRKPLAHAGEHPFADYLLDAAIRHGFKSILVIASGSRERMGRYADKATAHIAVTCFPQAESNGSAGALFNASHLLEDEFLLLDGDFFFDINLLDLAALEVERDCLAKIALRETDQAVPCTVTKRATSGGGVAFAGEALESRSGPSTGGVYVLRKDILGWISGTPCSLERDIFPAVARAGRSFGKRYDNFFMHRGGASDFERVDREMRLAHRRPAAFLDRDGVLNVDTGYVHKWDDFEWIDGAISSVKRLNDRGYLVFVVTNQAGVAYGRYAESDVLSLHEEMNRELRNSGAHIDAFYYCPHHPTKGTGVYLKACDCRKPHPGLIRQALADWRVAVDTSFLIGDNQSDLDAAEAAGLRGILFRGGKLMDVVEQIISPDR